MNGPVRYASIPESFYSPCHAVIGVDCKQRVNISEGQRATPFFVRGFVILHAHDPRDVAGRPPDENLRPGLAPAAAKLPNGGRRTAGSTPRFTILRGILIGK